MQNADFAEIVEIIEYLVKKENDETLLRAYKASYAALQNIKFDDFKRRVQEKSAGLHLTAKQPSVEEIYNKVEKYIDNFHWQEV